MGWTEERVELLKKLWLEGLSASQIAGVLGEGVTRNAVIGKVHRLKLTGRAKPASSAPRARTRAARAGRPPRLELGARPSELGHRQHDEVAQHAERRRRRMTHGATALKIDERVRRPRSMSRRRCRSCSSRSSSG